MDRGPFSMVSMTVLISEVMELECCTQNQDYNEYTLGFQNKSSKMQAIKHKNNCSFTWYKVKFCIHHT